MNQKYEPKYEDFVIPGHPNIVVPIMILHGKKYLQVAQRLVWFNLEKQDWTIETEIEKEWQIKDILVARFKCIIKDPSGRVMRVARKTKTIQDPKDYESCETGSIGRALSLMGYGTAYSEDMDEDEVVDSPQPSTLKPEALKKSTTKFKPQVSSLLQGATAHPFAEAVALNGRWVDQTFETIFNIDSTMKFDWTLKRNEDDKQGKLTGPQEWARDYLKYAEDSGLALP